MMKNESYIRVYKSLALQTFNTIVLILLLNLILAGLLWVRDTFLKSKPTVDQRVLSHREKYSDLKAYTVMKPLDVNRFLDEQDAMGSIGFQYEAWAQFRNPEFHGTFLNTDERGFRKTKDPQFSNEKPINISVFGGSTTFGYGVVDDYTIPSFIQTILERQYPYYSILVKNYGQGFYYSSQEMLLLTSLIKDNDIPDFAIFIDGGNDTHQLHFKHDQPYFTNTLRDLWNFRRGVSYAQPKKDYSWIPMIRLAKDISRRLLALKSHNESRNPDEEKKINNLSPGTNEEDSNADYVVKRYKNNIRIIRSICRQYGIKCYFVWQPMPFYKYDRSLHRTFPYPGQIPKHWSEVYTRMKDYFSSDFLYMGEFLENVSEKVFVDDVHYNEKYNEKIATEICELLKTDLNDFASPNSVSNLKFTKTKMKIFREDEARWKVKKAFDIAVGDDRIKTRIHKLYYKLGNKAEAVELARQRLSRGHRDWETISVLLNDLSLHPDSDFRAQVIETLRRTYFPGKRILAGGGIISLGLTSDSWTIDLKPAYLLVQGFPNQNLSQALWLACNADPKTFPLTATIQGACIRIECTFKKPECVKIVLPEIPAGETRLFTIKTDKTWVPRASIDKRNLGVRIMIED